MPTILGRPFDVSWNGKPPQITHQEWEIWEDFKDAHYDEIKRIFYNVRVGGGIEPPLDTDAEYSLLWLTSTMLRIDAVVETDKEVWIIELRPRLTKSMLGSLHIYLALWNADPKIDKPAFAIGVVEEGSPIIEDFCCLNNYRIEIV